MMRSLFFWGGGGSSEWIVKEEEEWGNGQRPGVVNPLAGVLYLSGLGRKQLDCIRSSGGQREASGYLRDDSRLALWAIGFFY